MGPLDAIFHLTNLFSPAIGTALLAAAGMKWLWRRELGSVSYRSLSLYAMAGGALATIAGLVILGRDGRMTTYGAMVLAISLMLWWRGFGRRR